MEMLRWLGPSITYDVRIEGAQQIRGQRNLFSLFLFECLNISI